MTNYISAESNPFDVGTFDQYIEKWERHLNHLKEMRTAGVEFQRVFNDGECECDLVTFFTTDPEIAKRFGLVQEIEEAA